MTEARPPYRQPELLALVLLGGAAGTTARWGTGVLVGHVLRIPLGTVLVNVVGAFVLGALLEHLGGRGRGESASADERNAARGTGVRPPRETGRRRAVRLTLGTGFCGGFTTYSALADDTGALLRQGLEGPALAYVAVTLVLGFLASGLGVALARRAGSGGGAAA